MDYYIEEIKGFRAVGLKRSYNCQNGENFEKIPLFWKEVMETGEFNNIMDLMDGEPEGSLGICANFKENVFDYFIAVPSSKETPSNMDELFIETHTYAVFPCTIDTIQEITKHIYGEWLPNSEFEHAQNVPEFELYDDSDGCKICIPIVKSN